MKQILIFFCSLFYVSAVSAQSVAQPWKQQDMHSRVLNMLLQPQLNTRVAMKPTAGPTLTRLVAQSTRDNSTMTLNDSLDLVYSSNMGSTYDYNTMIYPYNYPYNTSPVFSFAGVFTKPQLLFDTLRHWTVNPNTLVYGYYETGMAEYDVVQNLTGFMALYVDSAFYPNMLHANTFTTAGNISAGISSTWALGVADSAFKQYYTYNTANKLIKDSTYEMHLGTWRQVSRSFYTYDISGNLIQIENYANTTDTSFTLPLVKQYKYINTYDGSNRLLTVLDSAYNGTALAQNRKDTFAYTGSYPFHTSWRQHQWDVINAYWAPMFNMSKHLNIGGKPDTVNIMSFDSLANNWVPMTMNVMHYNTANDPDTLKDYEYNFTAFPPDPDFTTTYYYETYVLTLGITGPLVPTGQVKVFPNPATDGVTVSGLNVPLNSRVVISVINSAGQVVSRQAQPWQGEAHVSVADLLQGNYTLIIHDGKKGVIHTQKIVKQ